MFTVLLAAVLPMLFSMPDSCEPVAPLASVTVLSVMSMFADAPVLPKMPRSVVVTVPAATAVEVPVLMDVKSRVLLIVLLAIFNPFW